MAWWVAIYQSIKTEIMNEETLVKMKSLKFYGMPQSFASSLEGGQLATMTAEEMVSFLITSEYDDRHNRRIERQIRNARFRYSAVSRSYIMASKETLTKT